MPACAGPDRLQNAPLFPTGMLTMGYTHYWTQRRAFTEPEWKLILGETKRIIAKVARGHYYTGKEDAASASGLAFDGQGFAEKGAWRSFPHPEQPCPQQGEPILIAGPAGQGKPRLTKHLIGLNGRQPHDYETFALDKAPRVLHADREDAHGLTGFCKTEYRPYDAVVVSILAVAHKVAPDAIVVSSDGGPETIRYLF